MIEVFTLAVRGFFLERIEQVIIFYSSHGNAKCMEFKYSGVKKAIRFSGRDLCRLFPSFHSVLTLGTIPM